MMKQDILNIIQYIITESFKLKNKYINDFEVQVEFGDIFSRDEEEYQQLTGIMGDLGKIVYNTTTGSIYSLQQPIKTIAGKLQLVKIRNPCNKLHLRGDADFDTDYLKLKGKFKTHPNFELIIREKFEMLRLSDPEFDVMTCFSNVPVRKWI